MKLPSSIRILVKAVLVGTFIALSSFAGNEFTVSELSGVAKVQQSGKESWDNLKRGRPINSGDLIETFFKSRIVLKLGDRAVIIAGSNSKILVEHTSKREKQGESSEISVNLLSGGVFLQTTERAPITVFTSTGTVRISKGAVSAILDPKSGETGFQVLEGQAEARSLSSAQSRTLSAGQTTIIEPGRDAGPSVYITQRHVSVLKSFFGEEYITNQLSLSGIKPSEERVTVGHYKLSDVAASETRSKRHAIEGTYKRPLSMGRIYGAILDDDARENPRYRPVRIPTQATPGWLEVSAGGGACLSANDHLGGFEVLTSAYFPLWSAGLRLQGLSTTTGFGMHQAKGLPGVLDIMEHASVRLESEEAGRAAHLWLGALGLMDFGEGLLVEGFQNRNFYGLFNPLGVYGRLNASLWSLEGFLSDASLLDVGGMALSWQPGSYHFGAAYYYDTGRMRAPHTRDQTRFLPPDSLAPQRMWAGKNVHSYELGFRADLSPDRYRTVELSTAFAQTLIDSGGFSIKAPGLRIMMKGMDFGANLIFQKGKTLFRQIHGFYPMSRFHPDSVGFSFQNEFLPGRRFSSGVDAFYRVRLPWNISIDAGGFTELTSVYYGTEVDSSDTTNIHDTTVANWYPRNYSYRFEVRMGSGLVPGVQFARFHVGHQHAGYLPLRSGPLTPSWGFGWGAQVLSRPLLAGIAAEARMKGYYLDIADSNRQRGINGAFDGGNDRVIEYYAGLRWGAL